MKIPFLDLSREMIELINDGLMVDIEKTLLSGMFLFGKNSVALEKFMSEFFNSNVALVGSGTDAIAISLMAIGIKSGDMVAIPTFSAIPSAVAVKMIGAIPIYVDIGKDMNMSVESLEKVLNTFNIKAVVPVHLFGNPADIDEIINICNLKNIPVIEDCAQSFGSTINEKLTGTFGITGAFSFYPSKNLGSVGDAGLIITKNENLCDIIKELRFYGQSSKYKMGSHIGINSRADEIQCSVLLKKTKTINEKLLFRQKLKKIYDLSFLGKLKNSWIPDWKNGAVPHLYPILSNNRDQIMKSLMDLGIETAIHYPFCLFEEIEKVSVDCFAKEVSKQIFSIPFNPWLTEEEVEYIIKSVIESDK